jgi:hypothetical protein
MTQESSARVAPGPPPHQCYVELLGPARLAAGIKQVSLAVSEPIRIPELVRALADACPALVGSALDLGRGALGEGYILNRNGRDFLRDPAALVQPGDRLLLMSSSAGG